MSGKNVWLVLCLLAVIIVLCSVGLVSTFFLPSENSNDQAAYRQIHVDPVYENHRDQRGFVDAMAGKHQGSDLSDKKLHHDAARRGWAHGN